MDQFEQRVGEIVSEGPRISYESLDDLRFYQFVLTLEDKHAKEILSKYPRPRNLSKKYFQKGNFYDSFDEKFWVLLFVFACIAFAALFWLQQPPPPRNPEPAISLISADDLVSAGDNISLYGSRSSSPNFKGKVKYQTLKDEGIRKFTEGRYEEASIIFDTILNQAKPPDSASDSARGNSPLDSENSDSENSEQYSARKDPEILIFKNNSDARWNAERNSGSPIYTIAAAVPLSDANEEPFDVGQQMLFGIAQAQEKAIQDDRINLEVVIANDRNLPEQAAELAKEISKPSIIGKDNKERTILAVVGHYSSTVTCEALPIYNREGLPVISPASTRTNLRQKCGNKVFFWTVPASNFFRTVSASSIEAQALVNYLTERSGIGTPKIAAFYKKREGFSQDLFEEFVKALQNRTEIPQFDLSNPSDVVREEEQLSNFNVLAVFPDGRTKDDTAFDKAIEVVSKNAGRSLILGSNPLQHWDVINRETLLDEPDLPDQPKPNKLRIRKEKPGNGLVVAIDWLAHCNRDSAFVGKAKDVWGGPPVRLYALSYEAIQVLTDRLDLPGTKDRSTILVALGDSSRKVISDVFSSEKTISFDSQGYFILGRGGCFP